VGGAAGGNGRGVKRSGRMPGTLATLAWLGLPAPLVFHSPFIRGVILPLIGL
jgi:hypothetical protein